MKFNARCFSSIIALLLCFRSSGAVLDFETVSGEVPFEGMAISNQFQIQFGMSFRRTLTNSALYPLIGRKGVPRICWTLDSGEVDTVNPADPRANEFGNFFLTDDAIIDTARALLVDFTTPVSQASGDIIDIDVTEIVTITAYSDFGTNQVDQVVITSGDPQTGDGRSTPWSFNHATNDIRHIRFITTGTPTPNIAWDNFSSNYTPPTGTVAALDINMFAGVTVAGDVGRLYRIDYAETITPTNWVALTNFFLPRSPYLFIDTTSTNRTRRFYRAVNLP